MFKGELEGELEGDLKVFLNGDFEVDLEGDFRGVFKQDFKQDLEGDLLSNSGQLRSRSGLVQVWFSIDRDLQIRLKEMGPKLLLDKTLNSEF